MRKSFPYVFAQINCDCDPLCRSHQSLSVYLTLAHCAQPTMRGQKERERERRRVEGEENEESTKYSLQQTQLVRRVFTVEIALPASTWLVAAAAASFASASAFASATSLSLLLETDWVNWCANATQTKNQVNCAAK